MSKESLLVRDAVQSQEQDFRNAKPNKGTRQSGRRYIDDRRNNNWWWPSCSQRQQVWSVRQSVSQSVRALARPSLSIGTRIFGPFSYTREARPKRATSNHPNAKARRVLRSKNPRHLPQHASGPFPVVSTENESCLRRSSGFASPFPRGFLPVKIHMFLTFSLLR